MPIALFNGGGRRRFEQHPVVSSRTNQSFRPSDSERFIPKDEQLVHIFGNCTFCFFLGPSCWELLGGRGTSLNGTFGFERFGLCSERWRGGRGGGILNYASQPSGRLLRPPPPPSTVSKQINSSERRDGRPSSSFVQLDHQADPATPTALFVIFFFLCMFFFSSSPGPQP